MDRWMTYVRERFPIPTISLVVAGISLSGILSVWQRISAFALLTIICRNFLFFCLIAPDG